MRKIVLLFSLIFVFSATIWGQSGKSTGIVVDDQGEPLIGVVVTAKENPQIKVLTNLDGKFQLGNEWLSKKIVITYFGMNKLEVTFTANGRYVMSSESIALSEVVVTGMTSSDRRLFTGSTTKIDAPKLN